MPLAGIRHHVTCAHHTDPNSTCTVMLITLVTQLHPLNTCLPGWGPFMMANVYERPRVMSVPPPHADDKDTCKERNQRTPVRYSTHLVIESANSWNSITCSFWNHWYKSNLTYIILNSSLEKTFMPRFLYFTLRWSTYWKH